MKWISVKDRLPEEGRKVVAAGHGGAAVCYFNKGWELADGVDVLGADGRYSVECDFIATHWMPLPEPPEADND